MLRKAQGTNFYLSLGIFDIYDRVYIVALS